MFEIPMIEIKIKWYYPFILIGMIVFLCLLEDLYNKLKKRRHRSRFANE